MKEDYWYQEAGICKNPSCDQKVLNYHAGCCPRCGTWQNSDEDPGITFETKIEFHSKDLKEVFQEIQEGKDE